MNLAPREQRIAVSITSISLRPPEDNRIEAMTVIQHICGIQEERWVEEPDQHPKPEVIALVWRCGKQQEIPAVTAKRLGEFEILRLRDLRSGLIGRQMMRLVKDDQIPWWSFEYFLDTRSALESVDAGNQAVVLGKGV